MANIGDVKNAGKDYEAILKEFGEAFATAPKNTGLARWTIDPQAARVDFLFLGEPYRFQLRLAKNKDIRRADAKFTGRADLLRLDEDCKPMGKPVASIYLNAVGQMSDVHPIDPGSEHLATTAHPSKPETVEKLIELTLASVLPTD